MTFVNIISILPHTKQHYQIHFQYFHIKSPHKNINPNIRKKNDIYIFFPFSLDVKTILPPFVIHFQPNKKRFTIHGLTRKNPWYSILSPLALRFTLDRLISRIGHYIRLCKWCRVPRHASSWYETCHYTLWAAGHSECENCKHRITVRQPNPDNTAAQPPPPAVQTS